MYKIECDRCGSIIRSGLTKKDVERDTAQAVCDVCQKTERTIDDAITQLKASIGKRVEQFTRKLEKEIENEFTEIMSEGEKENEKEQNTQKLHEPAGAAAQQPQSQS